VAALEGDDPLPTAKGHELVPSARRLIKSLRDLGYDFAQAVADLVDNSIEAGASRVNIDVEFEGDDSWVRITDDGKGMAPDELREAMRYGTEREYHDDDLGKFGLGLKTASMSQCQRLSVATRWNRDRADIAAYAWDLDHIEKTNRWEILPIERDGLGPVILEPLKHTRGTVVLWQRLDRILGYKHPYGENALKRLFQMCRGVEVHLGMVFHRFLAGTAKRKKLKLVLNGNQIAPWDPFCENEKKTRKLRAIVFPVEHEAVTGDVHVQPYILPHQDDFSSPEAFQSASGPANWNQQQGFYIYRADRMIQSGGWSNLRAPDEHTKLARIAVSFGPRLDDAFKINVAKMRVQMPAQIRDLLRDGIGPVVKLAREIYDRKTGNGSPSVTGGRQTQQHSGKSSDDGSGAESRTDGLTFTQFAKILRTMARRSERPVIDSVLERVRQHLGSK
jgi:Histidine kinase-, DNA gyrase B-, and HSP90-like ATPase